MSQLNQLDNLSALGEKSSDCEWRSQIANVRVSPGPYLALACVVTFGSALLLRANHELIALAAVIITWLFVPLLAFTDRIAFDGKSIRRQGIVSGVLKLFLGYRKQLR